MIFYLGTHKAHWLGKLDVPLFVSRRALEGRRTFPRARAPWALDSGGFTELEKHGHWRLGVREYARLVRRFSDEIGNLAWAAPMDWMCEQDPLGKGWPDMLARTGMSVEWHQAQTVSNFCDLRSIAPDLPIVPVLQGWAPGDYWDCWEMYARCGVDLSKEPVVGLGTVCRRQSAWRMQWLIRDLAEAGLRIHGFGFKTQGLAAVSSSLASADSLAWSVDARRAEPLAGCPHAKCVNCDRYALLWRDRLLERMGNGTWDARN